MLFFVLHRTSYFRAEGFHQAIKSNKVDIVRCLLHQPLFETTPTETELISVCSDGGNYEICKILLTDKRFFDGKEKERNS
jgi:hypothetical protein